MRKAIALSVFALSISGCATSMNVTRGTMVPAAKAKAKAKLDSNKNAIVTMEVERLANPKNLTPPQAFYLVWAQTDTGKTLPLGQLRVDDEGEASFTGTVAANKFRLMVTAEAVASVDKPSATVVLSTTMVEVD